PQALIKLDKDIAHKSIAYDDICLSTYDVTALYITNEIQAAG
ncbi:unnamed protein product, partial [marine sediment metagenome]